MIVEGIPIRLRVLVIRTILEGIDVVLGMGGIAQLGEATFIGGLIRIGMRRDSEGRMKTRPRPGEDIGVAMGAAEGGAAPKFDPVERATPCTIEAEDFLAEFDGRKWEVECSAPRIMTRILKTVLEKTETMKKGTDSYLDDILVDDSVVSTSSVVEHLARYGLTAKEPEPLEGGAVLGLRLERNGAGTLMFRRGNEIPKVMDEMCKRELFSLCGKLVGHYPIAGWLRTACSYIKRRAGSKDWGEKIDEDVVQRTMHDDPVRGQWNAPQQSQGIVWCDVSSIATGAVLEIGGVVVEDGAWQRKKDDYHHINVSELDAVIKGINLAPKWGLREIEIRTNSATVAGWMNSVLTAEKRVRTKGAAEILVKRRLGILRELIDEFGMKIRVREVSSETNKADALTRVKKSWLKAKEEQDEKKLEVCATGSFRAKELHKTHHLGVDRSLLLVRKVDLNISREEVRHAARACARYQSIDPAPRPHSAGELCVEENWRRLAIDVTHYQGTRYLSMVDCGPGRFGIWRELKAETGEEIARGPVDEFLMENGTAFRSEALKGTLDKWNTRRFFRAAYRPSGNGIVERHHRGIKSMAEKARILPTEAVFLV
ncbi:uncharacterized protein LOC143020149 [Oratosquilla oratoria]|uniref:uncharacterized protein LOC143020149 n=1 Tax=Oratosquilla oratoria TaxID=337810 RepID=UPI003F767C3C